MVDSRLSRLAMDSTQPGSQRIAFDVPVNHEEVFVVLNRKALVPSLINVPQSAGGTFFFLISVLDGFSRTIVHWELRQTMKELDIELVIAKATEKHPGVNPRIISDNGPQFIAKDFKEFVRQYGLTHVRTSPFYPQSNGKLERWHGSLKSECIRPSCPACTKGAGVRIWKFRSSVLQQCSVACDKGDRLCEAPFGPFRQFVPAPFVARRLGIPISYR